MVASGDLVSGVAAKDRVDAVRTKMNTARDDWKNLMSNLHSRETGLQVSLPLAHQLPSFKTSISKVFITVCVCFRTFWLR